MYKSQGAKKLITWLPYLLILPSLTLFAVFCYYPFIKTIITSFSVTTEIGKFIRWAGLTNWRRVFDSVRFSRSFVNTFKFAGLNFVFTFVTAMVFALISSGKKRQNKICQFLFALPLVISATVSASVWQFVFQGENGFLNAVLGTDIKWLHDTKTAMLVVAFITSWGHVASSYLYLLVGFKNVSTELIEAATIDGAGWWVRAVKLMIPMASPQIFFVVFLNIVSAFKTFTQIRLLTAGGPANTTSTLMYQVYVESINNGNMGNACCYALVLFAIIFLATRIQFAFEKKLVYYQ